MARPICPGHAATNKVKGDAHTRIFHELLEPLLRLDLSGVQWRVLMWTARNTYGRNGAFFTPYTWRRIGRELKADRRGVARAGEELLKVGILHTNPEGQIGINKPKVRSLDLGQPSQGDNRPMGQNGTKEGTTVPGFSYKKEKRNTRASEQAENVNGFDAFWTAYPRKVARPKAWKAWKHLSPNAALQEAMLKALVKQKALPGWLKDSGQYVPHASTWINDRRWEDQDGAATTNQSDDADAMTAAYLAYRKGSQS